MFELALEEFWNFSAGEAIRALSVLSFEHFQVALSH